MVFKNIKTTNNPDNSNDEIPSVEEVFQMKKEMHMTGRAMRVDETWQEYNKEREASWERIINEQALKDQEEIDAVRQEIVGSSDTKNEDPSTTENYQDLSNVKYYEKKLIDLLRNNKDKSKFSEHAKDIIYEMLTRRSEYVKNTNEAGIDAAEYMKGYQSEKEWYRDIREEIEKSVISSGELGWDSNPGWFGINTRPEAQKRETINIKTYTTISTGEYSFIQHIPELATELRKLSLQSDDIIRVKIPESLSGFMANNDSIVIHFKNKDNIDKIAGILDTWMLTNNIHESQREMGRTKLAVDSSDKSFSQLIADNIADWLEQQVGKYDSKTLVEEAIKYGIKQSQKSPNLKNKN